MISRLIPNPHTCGWITASHKEKEDPGSPNKTKQNQTKPKANYHLPDPTGNKTKEKTNQSLSHLHTWRGYSPPRLRCEVHLPPRLVQHDDALGMGDGGF